MYQLKAIKEWIEIGKIEEAAQALDEYLQSDSKDKDKAYYLYGHIFRKRGDWQGALNSYRKAMDMNDKSPAVQAYRSILDILNFYNKDMYNQ
jgi:Tfp pilus assembly protein PilF